MGIHDSKKTLAHSFDAVWERLNESGRQALRTPPPYNHDFDAAAALTGRGARLGQRVVRIAQGGTEYARIYECCWGHTTNHYGTRIGGYSDALDQWAE